MALQHAGPALQLRLPDAGRQPGAPAARLQRRQRGRARPPTTSSSPPTDPTTGSTPQNYVNLASPYRCPPGGRCTWSPTGPFANWYANAGQTGAQSYWFVNNFHDHLEANPIGFTEASGNFELVNQDGQGGAGNDEVFLQALDGANTAIGYPDASHVNNANMLTLADGQSPTMQMYLFTQFPAGKPPQNGVFEVDGGDDASIVYHEYTHGLSNRLVGGPATQGTLGAQQSAAMGEGWSDWYAYDYLVGQGLIPDKANRSGELIQGKYTNLTVVRTQAIDCAVGASKKQCPAKKGGKAGNGGYTYGDYGKILGAPEVPRRRRDLGSDPVGSAAGDDQEVRQARTVIARTEFLVTNGLRLTAIKPSYLDARDGILQANAGAGGFNAKKRHLEGVRQARHGLERPLQRPERQPPQAGLQEPDEALRVRRRSAARRLRPLDDVPPSGPHRPVPGGGQRPIAGKVLPAAMRTVPWNRLAVELEHDPLREPQTIDDDRPGGQLDQSIGQGLLKILLDHEDLKLLLKLALARSMADAAVIEDLPYDSGARPSRMALEQLRECDRAGHRLHLCLVHRQGEPRRVRTAGQIEQGPCHGRRRDRVDDLDLVGWEQRAMEPDGRPGSERRAGR